VVQDFDDSPTHARLASNLYDAPSVAPEVDGSALPPQVHLFGERLERGSGINRHLDFG
jgi:hypothetical protein